MNFQNITICGGGNAAHAVIPVLRKSFSGMINLFLPYGDEAARFNKLIDQKRHITATIDGMLLNGRPDKAGRCAKEVCQEADLVLILLPAFAHEQILRQVVPFLKDTAIIGAIPARSGFEYAALKILKDNKRENMTIFGMQTLPWACRIQEYAAKVDVLGTKKSVGMAAFPHQVAPELAAGLAQILGLTIEPLPNMLTLSLANVGQIIHPGIMYGLFRGKEKTKFRKAEIPLFYQGVTREMAQTLQAMSDEILALATTIKNMDASIDLGRVLSLKDWLLYSYNESIADKGSLQACFVTNRAYQGLAAPMQHKHDYYAPDFQSRYLAEDIPFGLLVTKAIAQLIRADIPVIDEVLSTTCRWMGKEYIREGLLEGKDLKDTRIPQNYGIANFKDLAVY